MGTVSYDYFLVRSYFTTHIFEAEYADIYLEPVKRYRHKYVAPLYIPIDEAVGEKNTPDNVVYMNMMYFDTLGVIPMRVKVAYMQYALKRLPSYIKEHLKNLPQYVFGFFISDKIRVPTLRRPISFKANNRTIYPVYIAGAGFAPKKVPMEMIIDNKTGISRIWFVDVFVPLAIVYTYIDEKGKVKKGVVPINTVFVGRYFNNVFMPDFGGRGEHYAFFPLFVPRTLDTSSIPLTVLAKNYGVYLEGPNDRKVKDD